MECSNKNEFNSTVDFTCVVSKDEWRTHDECFVLYVLRHAKRHLSSQAEAVSNSCIKTKLVALAITELCFSEDYSVSQSVSQSVENSVQ